MAAGLRGFPDLTRAQVYGGLTDTRLQVWMALDAIRDFGSVEKAAHALRIPTLLLAGAKNYGEEFLEEMAACREEGRRPLEELARLVPNHSFLP
jgi:hypothetical protein